MGGLAVVVHAEGNAQQAFVAGVGVVEVQQRAVVLHLCRSACLASGNSAARKCELLFVLTRPRQVSAVPVAHQAQRRLPHVELSGHIVVAHARQGDALQAVCRDVAARFAVPYDVVYHGSTVAIAHARHGVVFHSDDVLRLQGQQFVHRCFHTVDAQLHGFVAGGLHRVVDQVHIDARKLHGVEQIEAVARHLSVQGGGHVELAIGLGADVRCCHNHFFHCVNRVAGNAVGRYCTFLSFCRQCECAEGG